MGTVRLRLLGGALSGQVLWVEESCGSVNVKMAGDGGAPTTLQYRRDGATASFVTESGTAPRLGETTLGAARPR